MAYRAPAPPPPEIASPVELPKPITCYIARYKRWEAAAWCSATAAILAVFVLTMYGTSTVRCFRASADESPVCVAQETTLISHGAHLQFPLRLGAIEATIYAGDDGDEARVTVPGGQLTRAVDSAFARRVESEAKGFFFDKHATSWSASRSNTAVLWVAFALAVALMLPFVLLARRTRLEIDPTRRVVRVLRVRPGQQAEYEFSSFQTAESNAIDDSAFYALVLVQDATRIVLAEGREAMVQAAAAEINRHKRQKRKRRRKAREHDEQSR